MSNQTEETNMQSDHGCMDCIHLEKMVKELQSENTRRVIKINHLVEENWDLSRKIENQEELIEETGKANLELVARIAELEKEAIIRKIVYQGFDPYQSEELKHLHQHEVQNVVSKIAEENEELKKK